MAKLKPIGIKLDSSDLKALKKIAAAEQRSVGFLIRHPVKRYLEKKTDTAIIGLMDRISPYKKILKKMPLSHRYSNPAAFVAAWEKWQEEFSKVKGEIDE